MRSAAWILAVLTTLAICPARALAADPYPPLERHVFQHGGVQREYFVHVPPNQNRPLPVVLAIHGYGSTATGFAAFHDLAEHADRHGYIVVFPQGSHFAAPGPTGPFRVTSWNMLGSAQPHPDAAPQCTVDADPYPCPPECGACGDCAWASCHDDVGYFAHLLDELATDHSIDPGRVYALGMSNGGMMTLRLGCSLSARFAAIAPISGQLPSGFDCAPSTPLPMLLLNGGRDDTVRPDGQPGADGFRYVSADQTAATWAGALQCSQGPEPWATGMSVRAGLSCTAYSACAVPGQEVVSCIDPEETHNWPARRPGGAWPTCVTSQQAQQLPEQPACTPRQETGAHRGMDLIWEFFNLYARPTERRDEQESP